MFSLKLFLHLSPSTAHIQPLPRPRGCLFTGGWKMGTTGLSLTKRQQEIIVILSRHYIAWARRLRTGIRTSILFLGRPTIIHTSSKLSPFITERRALRPYLLT